MPQLKRAIFISAVLLLILQATGHAALIASYQMNSPNPLINSAGASFYQPNLVNPGGVNAPTYLPAGGMNYTGAYQFDGVYDDLEFDLAGYLFLGTNGTDYTVGFWISTTDSAVNSGYAGTPEIPVLGNTTGGVGFGLGIDGGKASFRHYDAGWQVVSGTQNVADGNGHYVVFAVHGSGSLLDIYVDGVVDVANQAVPTGGYSQLGLTVGLSYLNHYGAFTLDDFRLYDTALTAPQIAAAFHIPEPASAALLLLAGVVMLRRRAA